MTASATLPPQYQRRVALDAHARTVGAVAAQMACWSITVAEDIRRVRHRAVETLRCWGWVDRLGDFELVLSELVTNAVVHGAPPVSVEVTLAAELTIAVTDGSNAEPVVMRHDLDRVGGLGLQICDVLCRDVTVEHHGDGKVVRATIA